jgi:Glutathione S-transferase, N-terminal domain
VRTADHRRFPVGLDGNLLAPIRYAVRDLPEYCALAGRPDPCPRLGRSLAERRAACVTASERRDIDNLRRSKRKLYGFGPTRSLRAIWGLKELDADFEFVPVNLLAGEHKHPDFLRLNPVGKIPVLVDGDVVIPESAAIVFYLADKYPNKGLMPAGLKERAQVYRWVIVGIL